MLSVIRISALSRGYMMGAVAMYVLMNYLTDVWNLSTTIHAAGIVNIWDGITQILPILLAHFANGFMGDYYMLVISSLAQSIGLGFLSMSMPGTLGQCSEYQEKCIGHTQKVLFFTALSFISVGMAGHVVSLKSFYELQIRSQSEEERNDKDTHIRKYTSLAFLNLAIVVGAIGIPYLKPWKIRFMVTSIGTFVVTLLFFSGCGVYKRKADVRQRLISSIKATEEFKTFRRRTAAVWITFIVFGIVLAVGNTYFLDQANRMDRKVGKVKVPIEIFCVVYNLTRSMTEYIFDWSKKFLDRHEHAPAAGMVTAMITSVLCCITAAKVETRRLHVIKDHGLLDKPDENIPMSIFWLVPQFMLLAAVDGIANTSILNYFKQQAPKQIHEYLMRITNGVLGLGTIASVLLVRIVRKHKPNWIQPTLNESSFDRYYWMLAVLSASNLVIYLFSSKFRHLSEEDDD